jgi:hypothetical protein
MPVNLGNPTWLTLAADSSTPAGQQQYAGRIIAVPAGTVLPTAIDSITVSGVTLWGYVRTVSGELQWLIQPAADPNKAAVDAIPGTGGWTDLNARQVFYDQGLYLLQQGVPGAELRPGLKKFYDASVAEYQARTPGLLTFLGKVL